jgi:hypothetical protein
VRGSDGTNDSNELPIQLEVKEPTDDPPTCYGLAGTSAGPGTTVTIDLSNYCYDDEGSPLDFEILRRPGHGELTGPDSGGRFTLRVEDGWEGMDSLSYTATDGTQTTEVHRLDISSSARFTTGGPACTGSPVVAVAAGGTVTIGPDDLCQGDVDGYRVRPYITPPAHGTVVTNLDGTISYTPEPGYSGHESFGVAVDDGERIVMESALRLEVGGPANAVPQCADTSLHVLRDTVTPVPLRCSDADGDALLIRRESGSGPSHGRLGPIDSYKGVVAYRPLAGFLGEDMFKFLADDGRKDGVSAPATARLVVVADGASREAAAGETVASGDGASDSDPITAAVTSPVAGRVSVFEGPPAADAPAGYSFLGHEVSIEAPGGTVENPLRLVFEVAAALLPAGADDGSLTLFRNGVAVGTCSGPAGHASPTPCMAARERLSNGNLRLTVLTVAASRWSLGRQDGSAPPPDPGPGGNPPAGGSPPGGDPAPGGDRPDAGTSPDGGGGPGPADTTPPKVELAAGKGQSLRSVLRNGLRLEATCSEACRVSATLALAKKVAKRYRISTKLGSANATLATGRGRLTVKLSKGARRALARARSVSVTVSARGTDLAGNAAAAKPRSVLLRR